MFCLSGVFCFGVSVAQERATKEECIAKAKEAAALIKEVGFEAAKVKASGPQWAIRVERHLYLGGRHGWKVLTHPVTPSLVGKTLIAIKDVNGKMFNAELIGIATTAGEGWVTYMWPKPGEKEPSGKMSDVYRVPGANLVVVAGIYQ